MSEAKSEAKPVAAAAAAGAAPAAKGSKLVLVVALLSVMNVGATGFVAYRSMVAPAAAAAATPAAAKDGHAPKEGHAEAGGEHEAAPAPEGGEHGSAPAEEGGEHGEKAEGEHGEKAEGAAPRKLHAAGAGPVVNLDPFLVNLNEEDSTRYLKTTLELELANDYFADGLNRSKSAVRDEVFRYLSNLAVADTLGEVQKTKIRDGIADRIDKVLGRGSVRNIYFTDFVVQ
jgi:flagellar FliL protein